MDFQPRYDEEKKIYRDCRFCQGRGCIACPGEAEKAYKAEFPNGPQPILTIERKDMPKAMKMLKHVMGPKGMMAAKAEGLKRARKLIAENPSLIESTGLSKEQAELTIGTGLAGGIVHDKILELRPKLEKNLKSVKINPAPKRKRKN